MTTEEILLDHELVEGMGYARKLVAGGAVKINGVLANSDDTFNDKDVVSIQIGKTVFKIES